MRQPLGIYAIVNIDGCVAHPDQGSSATITTDECISNNIAALLSNPAISGVAAFVRWRDLSPSVPTNSATSTIGTTNWSILNDVFGAVSLYNAQNPTNIPKTIQLGLHPGFWTPQWVLNQLGSCDAMFRTNPPNPAFDTSFAMPVKPCG